MEIITASYDNMTLSQLNSKLAQKVSELHKIDQDISTSTKEREDYFDISNPNNYDKNDFARVLDKFKQTDLSIRSHEQAHATIGHTTSPISYTYQEGPDGKLYAVGGSVHLDTSIPDDPKAAQYKLDNIKKAASGVSDESGADSAIVTAASLNKMIIQNESS